MVEINRMIDKSIIYSTSTTFAFCHTDTFFLFEIFILKFLSNLIDLECKFFFSFCSLKVRKSFQLNWGGIFSSFKSEIRFEPLKVECKAYLLYLNKLLHDFLIDM